VNTRHDVTVKRSHAADLRQATDRVAQHYGKEAVQLTLYLPRRKTPGDDEEAAN
jgi:hypothetical protein